MPDKEMKEKIQQKINTIEIDTVITPPDKQEMQIEKCDKNFKEKKTISREKMFVELLKENGKTSNEYFCIQGENEKQMMRGEEYKMFVIPSLRKMVSICDEEGNATFVINEKIEMPESFDSEYIKSYLEKQEK